MFVSKLNFKKGISKGKYKEPMEWKEAQIEFTLNEGEDPETAKSVADIFFDSWGLTGKTEIITQEKPKAPNTPNQKKICAFEGCNKEINPRYRFCYEHFQKERR